MEGGWLHAETAQSALTVIRILVIRGLTRVILIVFSAVNLQLKVHLVKAMVFPVVMYGCENGTIKKAERRRIDAFELWCWRRLLRVPCSAR